MVVDDVVDMLCELDVDFDVGNVGTVCDTLVCVAENQRKKPKIMKQENTKQKNYEKCTF
jgi:hypothetical protein